MSIDRSSESADAHGRAAMLLIESLIHTLIESDLITVADAMEIVGTAIEVTADGAEDGADVSTHHAKTAGLLATIGCSLSRDVLLD